MLRSYYKAALVFGILVILIPPLVPSIFAHKDSGKNWVNDWVKVEITNKGKKMDAVEIIFKDIKNEKHNHWSDTYHEVFGTIKKNQTKIVNLPSHAQVGKEPECTPAANFELKFTLMFKADDKYYNTKFATIKLGDTPVTGTLKTTKQNGNALFDYKITREENVLNDCTKKLDDSKLKNPDKKSTAQDFKQTDLKLKDSVFKIDTSLTNAKITKTAVDPKSKSLTLSLGGNMTKDERLIITLPREVIDSTKSGKDVTFAVTVNKKTITPLEIDTTKTSRTLVVPLEAGAKEVSVVGTTIVPEFPLGFMAVMVTVITLTILVTRFKNHLKF